MTGLRSLLFAYFIAVLLLCGFRSGDEVPFTVKEYLNLANYFDSKQEMLDFFDFKKGDVIADIGAGTGQYEGAFSLLTDSITFYAEDIDTKALNQRGFSRMIKHYTKLKGTPLTNTLRFCIGTEKTSNLPDSAFSKILMISSFHEFTYKDEMLDDLTRKLKPGGTIYILETHCYTKTHSNVSQEEVQAIMKKHGFSLERVQSPRAPLTYRAVFGRG